MRNPNAKRGDRYEVLSLCRPPIKKNFSFTAHVADSFARLRYTPPGALCRLLPKKNVSFSSQVADSFISVSSGTGVPAFRVARFAPPSIRTLVDDSAAAQFSVSCGANAAARTFSTATHAGRTNRNHQAFRVTGSHQVIAIAVLLLALLVAQFLAPTAFAQTIGANNGLQNPIAAGGSTSNASNINNGVLGSSYGGAGNINGALKGNGSGVVSRASCGDLSNAAASCSTDATNASNISSGTLNASRMPLGLSAAPASGQIPVGNAAGTAYSNQTISGDATLSNSGSLIVTRTNGAAFAPSATIDTTNANNITSGNMGRPVVITLANNSSTPPVLNEWVVASGSPPAATVASTTTTKGVLGICVSNCSASGSAVIQNSGLASCVFDGGVTASDYVTLSTTVRGECHDAGATQPVGSLTVGTILNANSGSPGTYTIQVGLPTDSVGSGGSGVNSPNVAGNPSYYGSSTATVFSIPYVIHSNAYASIQAAVNACPASGSFTACHVIVDPSTSGSPWQIGSSVNISSAAFAGGVVTLTLASSAPSSWVAGMPIHVGGTSASGIHQITPLTLTGTGGGNAVVIASVSGTTVTYNDSSGQGCASSCGSASVPLVVGSTNQPVYLDLDQSQLQCNGISGGDCIELGPNAALIGSFKITGTTNQTGSVILPSPSAYITSLITSANHGPGGNSSFITERVEYYCNNGATLTQGCVWYDGVSGWGLIEDTKINGAGSGNAGTGQANVNLNITATNNSVDNLTMIGVDIDGFPSGNSGNIGMKVVPVSQAIATINMFGGMIADLKTPTADVYIDGTNGVDQVNIYGVYFEANGAGTNAVYVKSAKNVHLDHVYFGHESGGSWNACVEIDGSASSTGVTVDGEIVGPATCPVTSTPGSGGIYNNITGTLETTFQTGVISYEYYGQTTAASPKTIDRTQLFRGTTGLSGGIVGAVKMSQLTTPGGCSVTCSPTGSASIFYKVAAGDSTAAVGTPTLGWTASSAEFSASNAHECPLTGSDTCTITCTSQSPQAAKFLVAQSCSTGAEVNETATTN
ncbi:MAG TPA: hypothetical protein VJ728_11635, partial [Candidatus Binataceae bacterium]|nr:hypothetical protein [Candidatus Binataceae bacterium]